MKANKLLLVVVSISTLLFTKYVCALETNNKSLRKTIISNLAVSNPSDCEGAGYQDVDGNVIIEAENLELNDTDWNIKTGFSAYTGFGYISWDDNNRLNNPGNG